MPIRKRRFNPENTTQIVVSVTENSKVNKFNRFSVGHRAFSWASVVAFTATNIPLLLFWVKKAGFSVSEGDITAISSLTAGFSGLCLAIPTFLKDFDVREKFWRQFYIIAVTFFIATVLGILYLLSVDLQQPEPITITTVFICTVIICTVASTAPEAFATGRSRPVYISTEQTTLFSYLVLAIALLFFPNNDRLLQGFLLFLLYSIYLLLTLMVSIFIQLFFNLSLNGSAANTAAPKSQDDIIKEQIQRLANDHPEIAFDEDSLHLYLANEYYPQNPEILSKTRIAELAEIMDVEQEIDKPKITVTDNDLVIPRWNTTLANKIMASPPHFIIVETKSYFGYDEELADVITSDHLKDTSEKIVRLLSDKCRISVEFLKEHKVVSRKYLCIRYFRMSGKDSSEKYYFVLTDKTVTHNFKVMPAGNHYEKYLYDDEILYLHKIMGENDTALILGYEESLKQDILYQVGRVPKG